MKTKPFKPIIFKSETPELIFGGETDPEKPWILAWRDRLNIYSIRFECCSSWDTAMSKLAELFSSGWVDRKLLEEKYH